MGPMGMKWELYREVSCARPNLEDDVCGLHACLFHDAIHHQGILQNMLALAFVELNSVHPLFRFGRRQPTLRSLLGDSARRAKTVRGRSLHRPTQSARIDLP